MNSNKLNKNVKSKVITNHNVKSRNGTPKFKNVQKSSANRHDSNENFIAPDGGWGWIVALASGIMVLFTFPVLKNFGILFRKKFAMLGISSAELTTIINVQQAVAMCSGLLIGPLFRLYSIRQVSILGNVFIFLGLFLTAFADSFISYLISISLFYAIGRGIIFCTIIVAVNTYFKEKRQKATAFKYAIASAGNIVMPSVTTFFVSYYGVSGAVLLISGLSLHNFACSVVYQPVEWHVKKIPDTKSQQDLRNHNEDFEGESLSSLAQSQSFLKKLYVIFDLDLLKDFGYINIAFGLTFLNLIQMNFQYLTPFILNEFGLDSYQIAAAMTTEATVSLLTKFLLTFAVEKLNYENKTWLIWGTLGMIFGRIVLVYFRNIIVIYVCFAWLGLSMAVSLIFWILILPSYVPIERLPAALGLQRLIMGLIYLILAPMIGLIRDASNYSTILHIMNVINFIVIVSWLGEDLYKRRRRVKAEVNP